MWMSGWSKGHVEVVPHGGGTLRKIWQIPITETSPRRTGYKSVRPKTNPTGERELVNKFDHTALLKCFQNLINMLEPSYLFVACSSHLPRGSVHSAWMLLHEMWTSANCIKESTSVIFWSLLTDGKVFVAVFSVDWCNVRAITWNRRYFQEPSLGWVFKVNLNMFNIVVSYVFSFLLFCTNSNINSLSLILKQIKVS